MNRSEKIALTSWLQKKKPATLGFVVMVALGATLAAEAWLAPGNDAADAAMAAIPPEGRGQKSQTTLT